MYTPTCRNRHIYIYIYSEFFRCLNFLLVCAVFDIQYISVNLVGVPRDLLVKVLECRIIVSRFELQSRYYVHLWTNTLGKGMNSFILPAVD